MSNAIKNAVRRVQAKRDVAAAYAAIKPLPKRSGLTFEELTAEEKQIFCRCPMTLEQSIAWHAIADKMEQ